MVVLVTISLVFSQHNTLSRNAIPGLTPAAHLNGVVELDLSISMRPLLCDLITVIWKAGPGSGRFLEINCLGIKEGSNTSRSQRHSGFHCRSSPTLKRSPQYCKQLLVLGPEDADFRIINPLNTFAHAMRAICLLTHSSKLESLKSEWTDMEQQNGF